MRLLALGTLCTMANRSLCGVGNFIEGIKMGDSSQASTKPSIVYH